MNYRTIIKTKAGFRGAVQRNGLLVAVSVHAWNNRNAAAIDAYNLSRAL